MQKSILNFFTAKESSEKYHKIHAPCQRSLESVVVFSDFSDCFFPRRKNPEWGTIFMKINSFLIVLGPNKVKNEP